MPNQGIAAGSSKTRKYCIFNLSHSDFLSLPVSCGFKCVAPINFRLCHAVKPPATMILSSQVDSISSQAGCEKSRDSAVAPILSTKSKPWAFGRQAACRLVFSGFPSQSQPCWARRAGAVQCPLQLAQQLRSDGIRTVAGRTCVFSGSGSEQRRAAAALFCLLNWLAVALSCLASRLCQSRSVHGIKV